MMYTDVLLVMHALTSSLHDRRKAGRCSGESGIGAEPPCPQASCCVHQPRVCVRVCVCVDLCYQEDTDFCNNLAHQLIERAKISSMFYCGCSVLSIDLLSKTGHPGNPRGRTKSSLKRCWIHDIPAIVELSFSKGVFTAAGKCRLQVEGTCIGNQIFPHPFRPARVNGRTTIPSVSANYFVLVFSVSQICGQPAFVGADSHAAI